MRNFGIPSQRGKIEQMALDLGAVVFAILFVCVTAVSIPLAILLMFLAS